MRPQQATNSGNAANAFQQSLAQGWQQALASFQQMAQSSPQTGSLAFNPAQLQTLKDHQEFLLKLLTNKDSFIRKKIIDQNLAFLNN